MTTGLHSRRESPLKDDGTILSHTYVRTRKVKRFAVCTYVRKDLYVPRPSLLLQYYLFTVSLLPAVRLTSRMADAMPLVRKSFLRHAWRGHRNQGEIVGRRSHP